MSEADLLSVEVVYALPQRQWRILLRLPAGSKVVDAIDQSGLRQVIRDLIVDDAHVGIFSHPTTLQALLRDGDRVELYRPLQIDPKDARRQRAEQNRPPRKSR
jgi:putative ubiquitin-RnfH superfamily antitoxin RatB of RatAB toxin-antitoxin module